MSSDFLPREVHVQGRSVTSAPRPGLPRALSPLFLASLLLLAACQFGAGREEPSEPKPAAKIALKPADGTEGWRPDHPVEISSTGGRLESVRVTTASGKKVEGEFNERRTAWTTTWALHTDTKYRVTATAVDSKGLETTEKSSFTTLDPASTIDITSVNAAGGNTYGVGIPIVVQFDKPVFNKEWVENAFEVRTSEPITGAWHWMSRHEVHFRPKEYWPTGTKVHLIAHFNGVRAARGVYGVDNVFTKFEIGDKHITKINTNTHTMKVKKNGEVSRTFDISAGRSSYPTTSGTHVVFQRDPKVIMDSATVGIPKGDPDYYRLKVDWTVKFSFSGLYTHSAPWTVGVQGSANVSHGCVNMRPDQAKWYYNFSQVGDIIDITGTSRELDWGNGWTDWDISFADYLEGSATGEPVKTLTMDGEPRDASPTPSPSASPTGRQGSANPSPSAT